MGHATIVVWFFVKVKKDAWTKWYLIMIGFDKIVWRADLTAVSDGQIDGPVIYRKFTDSGATKSAVAAHT